VNLGPNDMLRKKRSICNRGIGFKKAPDRRRNVKGESTRRGGEGRTAYSDLKGKENRNKTDESQKGKTVLFKKKEAAEAEQPM